MAIAFSKIKTIHHIRVVMSAECPWCGEYADALQMAHQLLIVVVFGLNKSKEKDVKILYLSQLDWIPLPAFSHVFY